MLKKYLSLSVFLPILLACLISCSSKDGADNEVKEPLKASEIINNPQSEVNKGEQKPVMSFDHTVFDFEKLTTGQSVEHTYEFTNRGNAPLIVSSAVSSCGCTVPAFSGDPVAPGEKGKIVVRFDSEGKLGVQERQVTVVTNAQPDRYLLTLRGTVVPYSAKKP